MKRPAILAGIGASMLVLTLACSSGNAGGPMSPSAFGSAPAGGTTIMGTTSGLTSLPSNRQVATAAISAVSTVQVCVNGPTTCTTLDEAGRFELRGEFVGDVGLEVLGLEGSIILLTIPAVIEGETIVVRLEIDDSRSRIEILSRHRNGNSLDDSSSDGASGDDSPSRDNPSEESASEGDPSEDDPSDDDPSDDSSSDDTSDGPVPAQL